MVLMITKNLLMLKLRTVKKTLTWRGEKKAKMKKKKVSTTLL